MRSANRLSLPAAADTASPRERRLMTRTLVAGALGLSLLVGGAGGADARGCVRGAVVGGVVGHFAGHHALVGAAAGCVIGHHMAQRRYARHHHW
jgi:hypothetical protein